MAFAGFGGSPAAARSFARSTNPNDDIVVCDPPIDSIQALEWSPRSNLLACASWDCTVKAYEVDGATGESSKVGEYKNDAPALDLCWTTDGTHIASAGCDKLIKIWNPRQPTPLVVGKHEEPIRNLVACGGWDKLLKFWDPKSAVAFTPKAQSANFNRCPKPIETVSLDERAYAMDVCAPLVCVALAN